MAEHGEESYTCIFGREPQILIRMGFIYWFMYGWDLLFVFGEVWSHQGCGEEAEGAGCPRVGSGGLCVQGRQKDPFRPITYSFCW